MKSLTVLALVSGFAAFLYGQAPAGSAVKPQSPQGTVEHIKVHGKSLEGNLEGDSPDRDVFIYLPPSYAKETGRRYPVVYFLHGYGLNAERYWNIMKVPETADKDIAAGTAREMILVHPDAFTLYNGSMFPTHQPPVTGRLSSRRTWLPTWTATTGRSRIG